MDLEKLKFPIGKFQQPSEDSKEQIDKWITDLEELPNKLRDLVENLSYDSLDWIYRPKGWTIKQVVHHLADSHMNSFIRFKLVMTEEKPTVRPYDETAWAEMPDANNPDIGASLSIIEGVHERWTTLLKDLISDDWNRPFIHPEINRELKLSWMIALYSWHSQHHLAHIRQAIEKEGDFTWED